MWIGRPQPGAANQPDMIDLTQVAGSRSVSHLHAQVYRTSGGWILHEGNTTNPTLVAGRELKPGEDVPLAEGESIQLGRVRLTFHEVRPVRVVTSDVLFLEIAPNEVRVDPGRQENVAIKLVNATGRVEQVQVGIEGISGEWYQIAQPDGTRSPSWRVQLVPTGPDLTNPVPNSFANATLVPACTRSPLRRPLRVRIACAASCRPACTYCRSRACR